MCLKACSCILGPAIQSLALAACLSLLGRDVLISKIEYSTIWERVGALKICAGL
jgi:hypothetical protein